jgi:hypothetical protein
MMSYIARLRVNEQQFWVCFVSETWVQHEPRVKTRRGPCLACIFCDAPPGVRYKQNVGRTVLALNMDYGREELRVSGDLWLNVCVK